MHTTFFTIGSVLGASAVGCGALGSHWIKNKLKDASKSRSWEIAAHYQLIHAVPLLLIHGHPSLYLAGKLLTAGVILFSGSIYGLVLRPASGRWLGPVTPLGGMLLMAGWFTLAYQSAQGHI